MKKFCVVLCFFLISSALKAQLVNGYGIKLGMGITNHTWHYNSADFDFHWDNHSGISARVFADFLNFSNFNIEGEIGYLQKGARLDVFTTTVENPDPVKRKLTNCLDYLSASLMGKTKYNLGMFTPYILLGPQFNYLAGKDVEFLLVGPYNHFKKSIFGYTAGTGTELKIMSLNFLVEYRFEKDLTSNYDLPVLDIKNYSHSVLIGVKF